MKTFVRSLLASSPSVCTAFLALCLAAGAAPAQQDPQNGAAVNDTQLEILANGDVNERVIYKVTTADWNRLNASGIGANFFHRLLGAFRADWEEKPGSFEMKRHEGLYSSFELTITEQGAAQNRGRGNWEYRVTASANYITVKQEDGRPAMYFTHSGNILPAAGCISAATVKSGLGQYSGPFVVRLPKEATNVRWEPRTRLIQYTMPEVQATGNGRLSARVEAREIVMSTAYKIYSLYTSQGKFSDQWVARSVFTNPGDGVIRNLRVTYKMRHADDVVHYREELVPGQTIVDVYYPSFLPTITNDPSRNVLPIQVSWTYEDSNGKTLEGNEAASTVVVGRNGFVFSDLKAGTRHEMLADDLSNAPLLAAWVMRNDHPIKEMAATAQDFATKLNANATTEDKLAWLYNTLMVCDVQYKLPAVMQENGVNKFDKKTVQNVYLPRDVLMLSSGTCIDLAICYAAMAFELNFDPYLMLIPGHCFPVIKVGTDFVAVETTLIQSGPNGGKPWREALKVGMKEFNDNINNPDALLIDLKTLWADGVSGPQLEPWDPAKLTELGKGREKLWQRLSALQNNVAPAPANEPIKAAGGSNAFVDTYEGNWVGSGTAAGNPYSLDVEISRAGNNMRLTLSAKLGNALVVEAYEGPRSNASAVLRLQTRTVTDTTNNEVRRDTDTKTELFLRIESTSSMVIERQRRDRNEPREAYRLNRA